MAALGTKETESGFDYNRQESSDCNKRDTFFKNMKIPRQYWNYITVDYIFYPLRERYHL